MIMTKPAFIYVLPIYILFWILRFIFQREEKREIIIGGISCIICAILLLGYCGLVKNQCGKFELTNIFDLNNKIIFLYSESYKGINNQELINKVENMKEGIEKVDYFELAREFGKKYNRGQIDEFIKKSYVTKQYFKYIIMKTINLSSSSIGTNYVEKLGSIKLYNRLGWISIPISFGMLYIMMAICIAYLIWKLIKEKYINYVLAFCTSMIIADLFTLIFGVPFESQRLFASSLPLVLLLITYVIDGGFKSKKV